MSSNPPILQLARRVCKARASAAELSSRLESVEKRLREAKATVKTICTDEEGL
jgi:hypothetical protein